MKVTIGAGWSGDADLNELRALRNDIEETERAIEADICALAKKHDIQAIQVELTYHLDNASGVRKIDMVIADLAVVV